MLNSIKIQEKIIKAELSKRNNDRIFIGEGENYISIIFGGYYGQFIPRSEFFIDINSLNKVKKTDIDIEKDSNKPELLDVSVKKEYIWRNGKEELFVTSQNSSGEKIFFNSSYLDYPAGTIYKVEKERKYPIIFAYDKWENPLGFALPVRIFFEEATA